MNLTAALTLLVLITGSSFAQQLPLSMQPAQQSGGMVPMTTGYWTGWTIYNAWSVGAYRYCDWQNIYYQLNPSTGQYVEMNRKTQRTSAWNAPCPTPTN